MHWTAIVLLVCLAATAASCDRDRDSGSAPNGDARSPGPSPSSSPALGNVSHGTASVQVAGDLEAEFSAPLASPMTYTPPGAFALRWVKAKQGIGIAGPAFTGTRRTSPDLSIVIIVDAGEAIASFSSMKHECNLTIDRANANQVAGSFTCAELKSADGSMAVDASGRFSASG
jgi:hypothetical protein